MYTCSAGHQASWTVMRYKWPVKPPSTVRRELAAERPRNRSEQGGGGSTMSDVARRAGVSTATVSRVRSGPAEGVRAETREKVLRAVAETGYFPNRLARNLRERSARIF